jgi:hypothetical protein
MCRAVLDTEIATNSSEPESSPSERVDLPQSYKNWRDYAFSEFPEDERK